MRSRASAVRSLLGRSAMFELDGTLSIQARHASASPQAWKHCTICNRARDSLHDFIKAKRAPSLSTKKMARRLCRTVWKATLARRAAKPG